ncbi:MAG: hypothetical protein BAJALOKI2v1_190035 [Promethearchaeota archaeon]|nr:MAG: hypothetical protein BAJALOKI2v1_190035 [Candidatus Lokiarchaeota archaeon]
MKSKSKSEDTKLTELEKKIVEKTLELIQKEGYPNVSAREIARTVGISVGTLYYHFKEGKSSVLAALASHLSEFLNIDEILKDGVVEEDEIREFFYKDLDFGRKIRPLIIAMESEVLKDPEKYISKAEEYLLLESMDKYKRFFEGVVGKDLSDDEFMKVLMVFKILVRKHIILRNLFGSDEEFMQMLLKILRAITE